MGPVGGMGGGMFNLAPEKVRKKPRKFQHKQLLEPKGLPYDELADRAFRYPEGWEKGGAEDEAAGIAEQKRKTEESLDLRRRKAAGHLDLGPRRRREQEINERSSGYYEEYSPGSPDPIGRAYDAPRWGYNPETGQFYEGDRPDTLGDMLPSAGTGIAGGPALPSGIMAQVYAGPSKSLAPPAVEEDVTETKRGGAASTSNMLSALKNVFDKTLGPHLTNAQQLSTAALKKIKDTAPAGLKQVKEFWIK